MNKLLPFHYWLLLGVAQLGLLNVLIWHWQTGQTPDRVAFELIPNLPVFWYAFCIIGGAFLGALVVDHLVEERRRWLFETAVPPHVRQQPLPTPWAEQIPEQYATVGQFLPQLHLDSTVFNLSTEQGDDLLETLKTQEDFDPTWLDNPLWANWQSDYVWRALSWCLVFALFGARLYHVLTPPPSMAALGITSAMDYFRNPSLIFDLRNGGLGLYGGIVGGAFGLWFFTFRHQLSWARWADVAVIGLALGQVFGRWGNFFNQELYGSPTSLPWAITIDPAYRLPAYADFSQFHPTFLYESLLNFAVFLILLILWHRWQDWAQGGELTAVYLILYPIIRTLLETVRLDSLAVSGIPVATFVSLGVALCAGLWLFRRYKQHAT